MGCSDPILPEERLAAARKLIAVRCVWALAGLLIRLYRKGSGVEGIAFEDLLQEGLCFGWSESRRQPGDATGLPGSTHGWVPRSSAVCLNSVR
jgi:hypothetical protein